MKGVTESGEAVVIERRRRISDPEILRSRDELIFDHRYAVRTRKGQPRLTAAEVARMFGIGRIYCHQILRRLKLRELERARRRAANAG